MIVETLRASNFFKRYDTNLTPVSGSIPKKDRLKGVQRYLNPIADFNTNSRALDHYQKAPIAGNLRTLEIFETARSTRTGFAKNSLWASLWPGPICFHTVPGKDSGDMISANNARNLAPLLAQRLRAAFKLEPKNGQATDLK